MSLNQFPRRSFSGAATLQTFTGNGSTTTYTLSQAQFQNESFVFVDDVAQVPGVDFTINGTTLTFTSAPANNAEIIVRGFGVPTPLNVVSDASVTTAKVADSAITHSKLHTTAIQDKLGYTPVSPTQLTTEINNLINSAPGALNTLDELAAALNDDANYATTITNALATKASTTYVDSQISAIQVTPTQVSDKPNSSTGYFDLPAGTTAQRPVSPNAGYIRFNTTTNFLEVYDGAEWDSLKTSFVATGGTITSVGGYTYHTFTSSGNFVVSAGSNTVDILTVAGGGGGGSGGNSGNGGGGGGGAGGYVTTNAYNVSPGTYSVIVGAGGARGTTPSNGSASSGSNSVFGSTTTAIGGGGGRNGSAITADNGGSGGGGSDGSAGGSGTAGQGNNGGGSSGGAPARGGGGGGGAGAAGSTGTTNQGANGGTGLNWQSLGTFYAGGGGGGCESGYTPGDGGNGGAGNAGSGGNSGSDALANRGSGGGGGGYIGSNGGNGSSGVVIVRYAL
jgi:hypothetical protein